MSSQSAQLGGIPTVRVDVPVDAVLLGVFFLPLAIAHFTRLQLNNRRGHKFLFNGMCFGYCMSRITALVLRIVSTTRPENKNVSLAGNIFFYAGVLLAYIMNNLLAWRVVRGSLPYQGWRQPFRLLNKVVLWLLLAMIIPLIIVISVRLKRPEQPRINSAWDVIDRMSQTYFLVVALTPFPLLALAAFGSREEKDPFGRGPRWVKIAILGATTTFASIEAGFRCGTAWQGEPPAADPAWWDGKAAYYCFNYMLDIFIIATYLFSRVDRRFHVPDKADGPMSYSAKQAEVEKRVSSDSNATEA